jgi:formylglycine-generating enzyme required for sulfatase activity
VAGTGGIVGVGGTVGTGGTCDGVLFDNGNTAACTTPTDTSVFTLSSASIVASLALFINTTLSGQTVTYTLLNAAGTTLSSGPTTKGSCDPYQMNWCQFFVTMNTYLPAGSYTVKSSAVATCSNSASSNVGFVAVKGCSGSSSLPDAGEVTGSGGITGSGGAGGSGGGPASCAGLTATCGPSSESCCKSLLVPGGTFYRGYDGVDYTDKSYPATVADFYLDKYMITVGRFRQFVNAGMGSQASPPASGAGAHPMIPGSGWSSAWNTNLPANTASLKAVKCIGNAYLVNWTDTAGSNERQPMNCIDWYEAFAFCAWDGGRLATDAEWNYAASGGSEQRYYPWSSPATSTTIDDSYAVYCGGSCSGTQNVGSKSPKGDGKWGQSDLAGNVWEWNLDWYASPYTNPCNNCADLTSASYRVVRGGYFDNGASYLRSASRNSDGPVSVYVGARCARTGP